MTQYNTFKTALRTIVKEHQHRFALRQKDIAEGLGIADNYLSMVIGSAKDNLAVTHLNTVRRYFDLSAEQTMELVKLRAALVDKEPGSTAKGMRFCSETLDMVLGLQFEILMGRKPS